MTALMHEARSDVEVTVHGHLAFVAAGPHPASCSRCLARRWAERRPAHLAQSLTHGDHTAGSTYFTPFGQRAIEAAAELAPLQPASADLPALRVIDLRDLSMATIQLVAYPDCAQCGAECRDQPDDVAELAGWESQPAPRAPMQDLRRRDVDDLDIELETFINPVCGPLGAHLQGDLLSPTTASVTGELTAPGRPGAAIGYGGHTQSFRRSAFVAVLEGLERLASTQFVGVGRRTSALEDLDVPAVDPRTTGLYDDAHHEIWTSTPRFRPDEPVSWVPGWSLRDARQVLVPELLVYYGTGHPRERFVQESSNGCASGFGLAEATLFGLLEVLERDSFLTAWYAGLPLPEIDAVTSTRRSTRMMVDRLRLLGYQARFFDSRLTSPVPTVTAVAIRDDGELGTVCFGAAAHLRIEDALSAALCEIANDAPTLAARTARREADLRPMVTDFSLVTSLHDHAELYGLPEMRSATNFLLRPDKPSQSRRVCDADPSWPVNADVRDDLRQLVDLLACDGFDVIAVDQSLPAQRRLGLRTVKVLVPGMLPIDFGWSRQRALTMPRLRRTAAEYELPRAGVDAEGIHRCPHPFP